MSVHAQHRGEPVAMPLDAMLAVLPSLPRPLLARLTQRLIDRMDEIDGDPDLEDDDPAGGSADDTGEIEEWQEDGIHMGLPLYGADQSLGPINEADASRRFHRARFAKFSKETSRA